MRRVLQLRRPLCNPHIMSNVNSDRRVQDDWWQHPIPPNVFFLGVELQLQAWAPDPAANTAGIVLTNGLTWTIGDY